MLTQISTQAFCLIYLRILVSNCRHFRKIKIQKCHLDVSSKTLNRIATNQRVINIMVLINLIQIKQDIIFTINSRQKKVLKSIFKNCCKGLAANFLQYKVIRPIRIQVTHYTKKLSIVRSEFSVR